MSVHKLKRTGCYLDKDLESPFHHQHLTGEGDNTSDNLPQLNEIDAQFVSRVKSGLAEVDLSNVDIDTFADKVKDTGLTFEDTAKDNIPYIRINQSWQQLHKAQIVTELDADSRYIDLKSDFTKVEVASGRPIHYYHFTLKDDVVRAIEAVSNKLDKLDPASQGGYIVTANADGTVSRSDKDVSQVLVRADISSNRSDNSKQTPASTALTHELFDVIDGLAENKSGCKHTVANAYTALRYYGITELTLVSAGQNYIVGDILHVAIPGCRIPLKIRVTEVYTSSAIDNAVPGGAIKAFVIRGEARRTLENSGREIFIPAEYGMYDATVKECVNKTEFPAIGGSFNDTGLPGSGAVFKIAKVTETASVAGTTLRSIEDWGETPQVGDFVVVAEDECHNYEPTIYLYVKVDTGSTDQYMWMYVQTLSGGVDILRYGNNA